MTDSMLSLSENLQSWLLKEPPKATAFIVTIYGDVVAPRGGTLWMGSLIECCAAHGINESLVRTAVSRLVSSGRLDGDRVGRKSYYRLSRAAEVEFAEAARILYAPPPAAEGWLIALNALGPVPGWAQIGGGHSMAPNRDDIAPVTGMVLDATGLDDDWQAFARRYWPLEDVSQAYERFLSEVEPVADQLAGGEFEPPLALGLRLRLVHLYRHAALRDPRLPVAAMPSGWLGFRARKLFINLYLALAAAGDAEIAASFQNREGNLASETKNSRERVERLWGEQG